MTHTSAPTPTRVLRTLAACVGLFFALFSYAADLPKQNFDLPAGDAESTLKLFTQQSGEQILYPPTRVAGITTKAVKGEMTSAEALDLMLANTELIAVRDSKTRAFTIQKASTVEEAEKNVARAIASSDRPAKRYEYETDEQGNKVLKLDTFEVFGRKTLNMDIQRTRDDPQPYVLMERAFIDRSGATTIEELLKQRLPMNTQMVQGDQLATASGGQEVGINLRGLGIDETLILVDGRRTAGINSSGAPLQPDINGIPMNAIERIEVLPTSAAGIYGGNATGGVINIILRRNYAGTELKLTYGNTFKTDVASRRIDLTTGFTLNQGRTSVMLMASYSDQNILALQDRDLSQRGWNHILANDPTYFSSVTNVIHLAPPAATTNIQAFGTTLVLKNGTSLNASTTFVPVGYAGTNSDGGAAFVANAGNVNLNYAPGAQGSYSGGKALLSGPTLASFGGTLRHEFTKNIQAFLEFSGANNQLTTFADASSSGTFTILASAPNNPFTSNINVTVPLGYSLKAGISRSLVQSRRIASGVLFALPKEWNGEMDYTWSHTRSDDSSYRSLTSDASNAIRTGVLDVLKDLQKFPLDLSAYQALPSRTSPARTTVRDVALRFAGPIFGTAAGPTTATMMAQHRSEHYGDVTRYQPPTAPSVFAAKSQSVTSLYSEVHLPLVGEANRQLLVREASIQLSGRVDDYTTNGASGPALPVGQVPEYRTNKFRAAKPTIALRYSPAEALTFRASYGLGFLPPSVTQLVPSSLGAATIIDPKRGNQSYSTPVVAGGTANLRPELSTSWSAGVIATPKLLDGLRISLDWTRILKTDEIAGISTLVRALSGGSTGTQATLNSEANLPSGYIIRGANLPGDQVGWAGPVTLISRGLVNLARTEVEAYDLQLNYRLSLPAGTFELFGVSSWLVHSKIQPAAGLATNERAGQIGFLKFRANAGITWSRDRWLVGWNTRYYDQYFNASDFVAQGNGGYVRNQSYHDIYVRYQVPPAKAANGSGLRLLSGMQIQIGVNNVLNTKPPVEVSVTSGGFSNYSSLGDPRLANYYFSVKRAW